MPSVAVDRDVRTAAIVLAGGRSKRMGTPKATLEWHGSTLVRHVAGIVARAVDGPVVVVRAAGQPLPPLPARVEIVDDAEDDRGPVQGIASGLDAIGDRAHAVYVSAVDAPLLHPAFVRHVLRSLRAGDDVALPRLDGFAQPLAAAYRATIAPHLHAQLRRDRRVTRSLFALPAVHVRELDEHALRADPVLAALDPGLRSLLNLNEPGEYEAWRERPAPRVTVQLDGGSPPRQVAAATLAQAAAAVGVALTARPLATLADGRAIGDPLEPLVAGDVLTFRSA
jgi:molybdopterin-guanine dinucleotide biosynthesis protein A